MPFPHELCPQLVKLVQNILDSDHPDTMKIPGIWGMLAAYQSIFLGRFAVSRIGNKVFAGPFRGMEIIPEAMDHIFLPQLLGTYEWELHETVESIIAKPYKHILNIGSSHGYYSIGFAMRMPGVTVHAYDIDDVARQRCRKMAEVNGVEDRVIVGGEFKGDDFAKYSGEETLVFMDIEGAERELLDPDKYPALKGMDVVVEMHDCIIEGLSKTIPERFNESHDMTTYKNTPFYFPMEKILGPDYPLHHFDNTLATWEGRAGPTPYGVFTKKA